MATDRYKLRNPTKQNLMSLGYRYYRTTDDKIATQAHSFRFGLVAQQYIIQ